MFMHTRLEQKTIYGNQAYRTQLWGLEDWLALMNNQKLQIIQLLKEIKDLAVWYQEALSLSSL